jgi:hypothetical protein
MSPPPRGSAGPTVWIAGLLTLGLMLLGGYLVWGTREPPPPAPIVAAPPSEPPPYVAPTPAPFHPAPVAAPPTAAPPVQTAPPLGTRAAMDLDAGSEGPRADVPPPPLHAKTVMRAIREATPKVKECYDQAREHAPELGGRLVVQMMVRASGGHGRIDDAKVVKRADGDVDDPGLSACVLSVLGALDFPSRGEGELPITYPFFLTE